MNNQIDMLKIQELKCKAESLTNIYDQNEKDNKEDLIKLVREFNSKPKKKKIIKKKNLNVSLKKTIKVILNQIVETIVADDEFSSMGSVKNIYSLEHQIVQKNNTRDQSEDSRINVWDLKNFVTPRTSDVYDLNLKTKMNQKKSTVTSLHGFSHKFSELITSSST